MLEKLIANLKQSLPEPLRKMLGAEEDSTENLEDSEKTQSEIPLPSEKKNNQISMIIRVVVVIGLGYLAFDHFFLTDNSQDEVAAAMAAKPRKRRVRPVVVAETTVAPVPTSEAEQVKPIEENPVNNTTEVAPPVENINIANKEEVTTPPPQVEEVVVPSTPVATEVVEITPKVGEVKAREEVDKSLDSLIDSVEGKDKAKDQVQVETKKETNLEDKIVADDIYTAPPVYDQLGRGLVYNCKEKHFACVDKLSYVSCNKNMKWNKSHDKPAECAVINVYNSEDDCSVVQKYNVSVSLPTPFCQ
jgi:hypothetical protein